MRAARAALLALALSLAPQIAVAVGTAAGTSISNTASVTADVGGTSVSASSAASVVVVAERIDVDVSLLSVGNVLTTSPATGQVLTYRVTNTGNGIDSFALTGDSTLVGDDFDPVLGSIYLDANANGIYDAGVDTLYQPGVNDPQLDASVPTADDVVVFVLNDIPAALPSGQLGASRLRAASRTTTGAPGSVLAGAGDGGTDAIVGLSGGDDEDQGLYQVSTVTLAVAKSSSVLDAFGGTQAIPGSTITYTLAATVSGTGTAARRERERRDPRQHDLRARLADAQRVAAHRRERRAHRRRGLQRDHAQRNHRGARESAGRGAGRDDHLPGDDQLGRHT